MKNHYKTLTILFISLLALAGHAQDERPVHIAPEGNTTFRFDHEFQRVQYFYKVKNIEKKIQNFAYSFFDHHKCSIEAVESKITRNNYKYRVNVKIMANCYSNFRPQEIYPVQISEPKVFAGVIFPGYIRFQGPWSNPDIGIIEF